MVSDYVAICQLRRKKEGKQAEEEEGREKEREKETWSI